MTNSVQSIALDKLVPHPDNPNRQSRANFAKLVRNIERTGRYEPLVVRPCPDKPGYFQIINGQHRLMALVKLGYKAADAIVWDIDDEQTDILLATLNRLGGSDELAKKLKLLKRLTRYPMLDTGYSKKTRIENRESRIKELSKLLPQTKKQIERLTNLKMPSAPTKTNAKCFSNPMVFFVNDSQQETIENALSLAKESRSEKTNATLRSSDGPLPSLRSTRAAKRAAALAQIAGHFLTRCSMRDTGYSKKTRIGNRVSRIEKRT